ncbi:putative lipid-transfer protein DIR1 [Cinnamomum micranthum f. kanehirae]|uniref:Putative lipid-transfer protein DIR1 n=1 Tax=Cinnamomum micranthum f. kanehirae TaxID=337451 RepID=A0A443P8R4_9MAGN|nr:putative lipid-transfer protein DIR1 [Cinnamomum micranthum f. kanehirae]|eukprot:TRINITY_DN1646_c0_g1_i1.p1 TRINITY_DN1646_c0_g1~~TRINITY_DN1646_c0_g1_i1.p1  ORF type:complete len:104 (+),score=17.75 TRINITY_DN1646_c0_g1_i1:292-603(+)
MALMGKVVLGVLVIAMFLGNIGVGPTMAFTLCGMTDEGIEACRPSIRTDDPVDPSVDCCGALSKADIPCLCSYKNSVMLPSLGIDPNAALQVPAKCNLPPPQC